TFADEVLEYVPASTRHLPHILHALERARPRAAESPRAGIQSIARLLGRAGIVVFLSDWYGEPETLRSALGDVRARGHDLIVFHVLDPAERIFPYEEPGGFEDLETGARLSLVPAALRERYHALVESHIERLGILLGRDGADYGLFETGQALDFALYQYLAR